MTQFGERIFMTGALDAEFRDAAVAAGHDFGVYLINGQTEREGAAIAAAVGGIDALADDPAGALIRMHSACMFSEAGDSRVLQRYLLHDPELSTDITNLMAASSPECDCRDQRRVAQAMIAGGGIYFEQVSQDGRGHGLDVKREIYRLAAEEGMDTVEACQYLGIEPDIREYGHVARFLGEYGIGKVRLLSNNPRKITALEDAGIEVARIPLVLPTERNVGYLRAKREKLGHYFPAEL